MKYITYLCLLFIIMSCEKNNDFLIAKNQVGKLDNTTKISEIEALLASDSVVTTKAKNAYGYPISSVVEGVEVYSASGQKILKITPDNSLDTISHIENIRILSNKYKTKNGLSIGSTFAELKKYHDISEIQTSLKSVIITLKDLNAFVSFDRNILPSEVRFDLDADIKPTMIPDDAEINRFWINFEASKDAKP